MPHVEVLPASHVADKATAHESILADIAILALVIADQIAFATTETERWALGFLDGMAEIEQHVRRLRRSCPCTSLGDRSAEAHRSVAGPIAALSGLDAIEAVAGRTQMITQHQDIVRQQLEALSGALAALHGQCRLLSVRAAAPSTGEPTGVGEIIDRLRRSYVVAGQNAVHEQSLARQPAVVVRPGG